VRTVRMASSKEVNKNAQISHTPLTTSRTYRQRREVCARSH
jgi:hypothetical protein